jgi:hypothetical protein
MVKRDRQLHYSLKMEPQRRFSRYGAPEIFENLMSVEKVRAVEKRDSSCKVRILQSHDHLAIMAARVNR